jgi:hypothetical protein
MEAKKEEGLHLVLFAVFLYYLFIEEKIMLQYTFDMQEDVYFAAALEDQERKEKAIECLKPIYKYLKHFASNEGKDFYDDENGPFFVIQDIIVGLFWSDGKFENGIEKDIYVDFCDQLNFTVLNDESLAALHTRLCGKDNARLKKDIEFFNEFRLAFDPSNSEIYHLFLLGLWCMALCDRNLNQNEYSLMKLFYSKEDKVPDWNKLSVNR